MQNKPNVKKSSFRSFILWILQKRVIIGGLITGMGIIGWYLGYIFSSPSSLAAGHVILYPLGQIAVVAGPIVALAGIILLVAFRRDIHLHKSLSIKTPVNDHLQPEKRVIRQNDVGAQPSKVYPNKQVSYNKVPKKVVSENRRERKNAISLKIFIGTIIILITLAASIAFVMNNQVTTLTSSKNSLQLNYDQLMTANKTAQSSISSLQSQILNLQNQTDELNSSLISVGNILSLNASAMIANITQGQLVNQFIFDFSASYAGYISINIENSALNYTFAQVIYNSNGVAFNQTEVIGTNGTAVLPVLPCNDVQLTIGDAQVYNGTITAIYYY